MGKIVDTGESTDLEGAVRSGHRRLDSIRSRRRGTHRLIKPDQLDQELDGPKYNGNPMLYAIDAMKGLEMDVSTLEEGAETAGGLGHYINSRMGEAEGFMKTGMTMDRGTSRKRWYAIQRLKKARDRWFEENPPTDGSSAADSQDEGYGTPSRPDYP